MALYYNFPIFTGRNVQIRSYFAMLYEVLSSNNTRVKKYSVTENLRKALKSTNIL